MQSFPAISLSLAPLHGDHGGDRGDRGVRGVHGVHENDVQDDRDGSAGGEVGGRDGFVQRACSKLSEVAETKRIPVFWGVDVLVDMI